MAYKTPNVLVVPQELLACEWSKDDSVSRSRQQKAASGENKPLAFQISHAGSLLRLIYGIIKGERAYAEPRLAHQMDVFDAYCLFLSGSFYHPHGLYP